MGDCQQSHNIAELFQQTQSSTLTPTNSCLLSPSTQQVTGLSFINNKHYLPLTLRLALALAPVVSHWLMMVYIFGCVSAVLPPTNGVSISVFNPVSLIQIAGEIAHWVANNSPTDQLPFHVHPQFTPHVIIGSPLLQPARARRDNGALRPSHRSENGAPQRRHNGIDQWNYWQNEWDNFHILVYHRARVEGILRFRLAGKE